MAIGIAHAHVPGAEPAVVEGGGGGGGVGKVAAKDLRAAGEDFAGLAIRLGAAEVVRIADAQLRIRQRQADGAGAPGVVEGIDSQHGRGLRKPIAFHQHAAGARLPWLDNARGEGSRARDGVAYPAEVRGCVRSGGGWGRGSGRHGALVDGGHAWHPGGTAGGKRLGHRVGVWGRKQDDLGRAAHREEHAHSQAIGMEHGQRGQEALVSGAQRGLGF